MCIFDQQVNLPDRSQVCPDLVLVEREAAGVFGRGLHRSTKPGAEDERPAKLGRFPQVFGIHAGALRRKLRHLARDPGGGDPWNSISSSSFPFMGKTR